MNACSWIKKKVSFQKVTSFNAINMPPLGQMSVSVGVTWCTQNVFMSYSLCCSKLLFEDYFHGYIFLLPFSLKTCFTKTCGTDHSIETLKQRGLLDGHLQNERVYIQYNNPWVGFRLSLGFTKLWSLAEFIAKLKWLLNVIYDLAVI